MPPELIEENVLTAVELTNAATSFPDVETRLEAVIVVAPNLVVQTVNAISDSIRTKRVNDWVIMKKIYGLNKRF